MPESIIYSYQNKIHTVNFSHLAAKLPVKLTNGDIKFVSWGRRQAQSGELPLGGWARLQDIHQGKWDMYFPKPVRLPITKFMENDFEGHPHWYEVTAGQWIQGLCAREGNELRVYIVTITPELFTACHNRWPRIVTAGDK